MENEQTVVLENSEIAKFKKSKSELFKRIALIGLIICLLYFQSFFGRHSRSLNLEFKLLLPTIATIILVMIFCFSKMISVVTIDKLKKELTIEYYQLFKKRYIMVGFNQFNFIDKESSNKNRYIKIILDNGKTFMVSDRKAGKDSMDYDRLLEILKENNYTRETWGLVG